MTHSQGAAHIWLRLAQGCYLALLGWQLIWRVPRGPASWIDWVILAIPVGLLLMPLRGVLAGKPRSMIWAGYLAVAVFILGVAEAWDAFLAGWLQPALAAIYVVAAVMAIRSAPKVP